MSTVELKNIKKTYEVEKKFWQRKSEETVLAVKDFNLSIDENEFIVLVGPSGCGKSTVLRMIAGLEKISEGQLYIDGVLMNDIEPSDRDVAMVFQNYALYPHLSVYENIAFGLKMRNVKKDQIREKVLHAARILGIEELLERKPKALSGGQKQRVAIGRAIVREPRIFLMDEPLSNLDYALRSQMRSEIIKLRQAVRTTFVYVTHDQTEAMTLGDRIVVMKDGVQQQVGEPQEVFNHPKNVFVGSFIGTPKMNFLAAELILDDGSYYLDCNGLKVKLSQNKQVLFKEKNIPQQKVLAGVRPDQIKLGEHNGRSISGVVDIKELMGNDVQLHVKVENFQLILLISIKEFSHEELMDLSEGQNISFYFECNDVHLFNIESGINLEFLKS